MEVKGEANFLHSGLRFNIPFFLVTHIYSHTTHPARQRQTIPDRFTQIGIHQAYETSNSSPPGLGRHRIAQRQPKPATNKKKKKKKAEKRTRTRETHKHTHVLYGQNAHNDKNHVHYPKRARGLSLFYSFILPAFVFSGARVYFNSHSHFYCSGCGSVWLGCYDKCL